MKVFIFDFDSTIFPGETLDEIIDLSLSGDIQQKEKSQEITNICNLGMSGSISMEESLKRRLEIAAPTQNTIAEFVTNNVSRIDKDISNILLQLQQTGYHVFVVSGGFEEWIKPLLDNIIPSANIHANKIKDLAQPMTFDNIIRHDKEEIIKGLLETHSLLNSEIYIIGDGATDFSVYENSIAQYFVGTFFYTGAEKRAQIISRAKEEKQHTFLELNKFTRYILESLA